MLDLDLTELSLQELKSLNTKVSKAIDTYEERRKKEALAAVEATAKEMGFSINELLSATKGASGPRPAKYRHTENPELTWSGRGRKPQWIKDAVDAGADIDDFLINP